MTGPRSKALAGAGAGKRDPRQRTQGRGQSAAGQSNNLKNEENVSAATGAARGRVGAPAGRGGPGRLAGGAEKGGALAPKQTPFRGARPAGRRGRAAAEPAPLRRPFGAR